MRCPCGQGEMSPYDFRDWLRASQEARLQAHSVLKSEHLGGRTMRRLRQADGKARLIVGPDLPELPEDAREVCTDW